MTDAERPLAVRAALGPATPVELAAVSPAVTVYGEPMLDGWWHGTSERMAREAPAPVVAMTDREYVPGGAANTAMNLAALGARVRFVGLAGADEAGDRIRLALEHAGIDVTGLVQRTDVQTITKSRVVVADQVLVRIDEGQAGAYPVAARAALAEAALVAAAGADAQVVCDYGTGMLHGPVRDALLAGRVPRSALTVVDAHDLELWADLHPDLVTPNSDETSTLVGVPLRRGSDRVATVTGFAPDVLERSGASAAVVTLDRDGTLLLQDGLVTHRTWARPVNDKQASGAGDTFAAALTLARVGGLPLPTSADFAQAAADVVAAQSGTSVCSTVDIVDYLARFADSALQHDELLRRLAVERAAGRRIVVTNGCFDVLHRGHTAYLNQAKRLGDILVVAINSDDSVRRLKGESRPINTADDRAGVLAALSCVDYVTVFATDTPIPLLERIRPDIYAKGGDYTVERLPEAQVVQSYGGQVRILDYLPDYSTTSVVDRIRSGHQVPEDVASEPLLRAKRRTKRASIRTAAEPL